jgi:hypothetical protein
MTGYGPSRHFAAAQQFGRIWSEADINHRVHALTHPLPGVAQTHSVAGAARYRLSYNQSSCGAGSRCLLPSFARCSW